MSPHSPAVSSLDDPLIPRVILIAVTSINGFMTDGQRPGTAFASPADQTWFVETLQTMDAIVMGAETYAISRDFIRQRLSPERPRYICTRRPAEFAADAVPDQLIFTRANPTDLIASLAQANLRRIALLGGGATNARFLHAGCVDEIWLTLEPLLFSGGVPLSELGPSLPLTLREHQFLSPQTLLLKYDVGLAEE